jgi:probable HAF family extracellular repeat protein
MKRLLFTLAAALSLGACLDSPAAPGEREPTPPDPPTGTDPNVASQSTRCPRRCLVRLAIEPGTYAMALNEHAELVGTGHEVPFRWSKATGLVRQYTTGEWLALNSWHRQVAGNRAGKAVVWSDSGARVLTLPDMTYAEARSINDWGRVVGTYHRRADDATLAYRWSPWSGTTVLPGLSSHESAANDINHANDAVGYSAVAAHQKRAVLWPMAGGIRELGMLPGHAGSDAVAISNKGHVAVASWPAGLSSVGATRPRAALWTEAGGLQPLGTFGGEISVPADVNAWGEVVGTSTTADGQAHAFVWYPSTGMVRLDEGGAGRSKALAINSWGDIVGTLNDGELVAWVWENNLWRWQ